MCKSKGLEKEGGENFPAGSLNVFSGNLLDTCRDLVAIGASYVTSVTVTHKGTDGWAGQYIRIILDDHSEKKLIFRCELGRAWIKESDGVGEQTFDCTKGIYIFNCGSILTGNNAMSVSVCCQVVEISTALPLHNSLSTRKEIY